MRILVLNYEFPPLGGGAGDVTCALCREYAACGHDVRVVTSWYKGLASSEVIDGFRVYRVRSWRRSMEASDFVQMACYLAAAAPKVQSLCRSWRPDVAHVHFLVPTGVLGWGGRRLFGVPYVVTMHGGDVPSFVPEQTAGAFRLARPAAVAAGRSAHKVVAVGEGLRRMAADDYPEFFDSLTVIPNGVDIVDAAYDRPETPTLLFAGRMAVQKNLGFLLRVLAGVDGPWRLELLGDGPRREHWEALAAELGLGDRVRFRGWVARDSVLDAMRNAHFLVMPSLKEGMSIAALQAFSCGLPVLGADVPGMAEFVEQGETGYLAPADDRGAWDRMLRQVLNDVDRSAAMAEACLGIAREHAWGKVAGRYLDVLAEAAATTTRREP